MTSPRFGQLVYCYRSHSSNCHSRPPLLASIYCRSSLNTTHWNRTSLSDRSLLSPFCTAPTAHLQHRITPHCRDIMTTISITTGLNTSDSLLEHLLHFTADFPINIVTGNFHFYEQCVSSNTQPSISNQYLFFPFFTLFAYFLPLTNLDSSLLTETTTLTCQNHNNFNILRTDSYSQHFGPPSKAVPWLYWPNLWSVIFISIFDLIHHLAFILIPVPTFPIPHTIKQSFRWTNLNQSFPTIAYPLLWYTQNARNQSRSDISFVCCLARIATSLTDFSDEHLRAFPRAEREAVREYFLPTFEST